MLFRSPLEMSGKSNRNFWLNGKRPKSRSPREWTHGIQIMLDISLLRQIRTSLACKEGFRPSFKTFSCQFVFVTSLRASSYKPGNRAGSVTGTNFVVCSYGKFQPGRCATGIQFKKQNQNGAT